jgi:hypothetical protein
MAIDSRRKRASIAGLALAFLAPSVVPDSTIGVADRQTIAHSYYGIDSSVSGVTIGDTSQLGVFDATGGITLERTLGGTSQLLTFDSTGGITLERTLGATSQLNPFTSSGGIQVGDVVAGAGGGPFRKRDSLAEIRRASQQALNRRRKAEELEAKVLAQLEEAIPQGKTITYDPQVMAITKIEDPIDRSLAIEFEAMRIADEEAATKKRRDRDKLAMLLLLQ